jgi:transposase-like protein
MNVNITDPIFHDEAKAEAHIFNSRWPDGEPVCPHCGSTKVRRMGGKTQAGMFLCNDCRDKFTVRTGTVMERSHVPFTSGSSHAPHGRFQEGHERQADGAHAWRDL